MAAGRDVAAVTALLGRPPQAEFDVIVRDAAGAPVVVRNAPFTADGTPMPTRYWLIGEPSTAVSRLESSGGVRAATDAVDPHALRSAHDAYAADRDAAIPSDHDGPRPSGGVGGTRTGIKCLHAHYAYFLAGGDDPVGSWVHTALASKNPHYAWNSTAKRGEADAEAEGEST